MIFNDPRSHCRLNGRTGGHGEAAQPEGLAWGQSSSGGDVVFENKASHDVIVELSMKAPMSVSKPADLG